MRNMIEEHVRRGWTAWNRIIGRSGGSCTLEPDWEPDCLWRGSQLERCVREEGMLFTEKD